MKKPNPGFRTVPTVPRPPVRKVPPVPVSTAVRSRSASKKHAAAPVRPAVDERAAGFFVEGAALEVSVLLGTVDRPDMLRACVESIRASVSGLRYEIVVAYGTADEPALPWMQAQADIVPVLGGMTGAIEAFNQAYTASAGRFICQLNDDLLVEGDSIARAVRHLGADPSCAGVVFKFMRTGETGYRHEYLTEGVLHPNQMVVRRSTCEAVVAKIGALWGDAEHRVDKTYGGDSAFGVVCHHLGLRLDSVNGVMCRDLLAQDSLRAQNKVSTGHFDRWRALYQPLLSSRASAQARDDQWATRVHALDPTEGRFPVRCGPLRERVLHLHLETADDPQAGLVRALSGLGEYTQIDWQKARDAGRLADAVLLAAHRLRPTLVFMQLQTPGVVSPELVAQLRPLLAPAGVVATWCGDVAGPNSPWSVGWQVPLGQAVDLTLHSSLTHVEALRAVGVAGAAYLQIGYDRAQYRPAAIEKVHDVCFLGNRYYSAAYLKAMRQHDADLRDAVIAEMANALGPRFALYGSGHKGGLGQIPLRQAQEAYWRSKIGLNISLCNFFGAYSSDRIFRILGCGALCLTKRFPLLSTYGLEHGKNCLIWDTPAEAVALARAYASPAREAERAEIAAAGAQLALEHHTWEVRMGELAALLQAVRGP